MPHLLSARDLDRSRIEGLFASAADFQGGGGPRHPDALIGLAFFEHSLRTRVGFDVAASRLGARTTTVHVTKQTPEMAYAESLADTVRSIAGWCDVLCLRHPDVSAVAALTTTPILNCGNGRDEHPTQALVDLFAMQQLFGRVDGLRIALVGDLHAMRSAHSLALALARFDGLVVRCIAPKGLELPEAFAQPLRHAGHQVAFSSEMDVDDVNLIYVSGLPATTRIGQLTSETRAAFQVTAEVVARLPADVYVLSPLPRLDEIAPEVDVLTQAAYFRQSELGLGMRMAVLSELLRSSRR